jgi:hypothetical protein
MATFDVDTMQMWRSAAESEELSTVLERLGTILRSLAGSAGATGVATSSTALQAFIVQWSAEVTAEARANATMAADLRAAAALYESTEVFAAGSFGAAGSGGR